MTSRVSRSSDSTSRPSHSTSRSASEHTVSTVSRADTGSTTSQTSLSSFTAANGTQPRATTGSLRPGARGETVRSLQDQLRAAGFDPGLSDGVFGARTERAIRDFQRAQGLQVDGIAGRRTFAALNGVDRMDTSRPSANGGVNGTARLNNQPIGHGLTTGSITVNGHTYQFNSGSGRHFSVPQGTYQVTAHRDTRSEKAFVSDGVGYSFRIEDASRPNSDAIYDARAGRERTALRIHPDGGARGTAGCIGIVGDAATQLQFLADMKAELHRNGGVYTLRVE
jgi:peptidoglycan hydrolase-like protein with peptidoglycan-binding domain